MECQKSKCNQRRPTTSMNRDNARTNKGRKRIQNQYNRNKYTQGQRDRFRKRIGINDIEYDDGYYNDEYDDYKHNDKYYNKYYEPIEVYNTEYYNDQEQSYDQYKDYTNKSYDQQDLNEQFDEIDIIDEYYDNGYNDNEYDEYDNEYDEYDDGYYDNYWPHSEKSIIINNINQVIQEINFIGLTTAIGLLTPYITGITSYFAKKTLTHYGQQVIRNKLAQFIQDHFSKYVSESLAHLLVIIIRENWDKIKGTTSAKAIARYILNKIIRGSGNLLMGKDEN